MARWPYLCLFGMAAMGWPASAFVFTLTPSGTVSGSPGSTAGWGYSITNSSSQYMVIVNSYFCESGQDPLFTTCTQALGAYSDFIANKATVIPPLSTATLAFNTQTSQGVGGYAIRSGTTGGQSDSGSIVLEYDLYTANPFTDPTAQLVGGDAELTIAAVVQVTGQTTTPVPVLSDLGMLALALLLIACATRQLSRGAAHGPGVFRAKFRWLSMFAAAAIFCAPVARPQEAPRTRSVAPAAPPSLGGTIGGKSGPANARVWVFRVGNNGPGVALNVEITGVALVQTSGPGCSPVATTQFPLAVGNIPAQAVVQASVTIDFTGCDSRAMFKVTAAESANSGAAKGTIVRLNQFR